MSERNPNVEPAVRGLVANHGSRGMAFSDFVQLGFANWRLFNRASAVSLVAETPAEPGVYVIRRRQERSQSGEHEIVYIGSAENEEGLKMRLLQQRRVWFGHAKRGKSDDRRPPAASRQEPGPS